MIFTVDTKGTKSQEWPFSHCRLPLAPVGGVRLLKYNRQKAIPAEDQLKKTVSCAVLNVTAMGSNENTMVAIYSHIKAWYDTKRATKYPCLNLS